MGPNGLPTIGAAGTVTGWLNQPSNQRKTQYQVRRRSIFGPLSQTVKGKVAAEGQASRGVDPSKTAAVSVQELSQGDEVRWSMEKVLSGIPTFGDRVPNKGGYLDWLHASTKLNLVKSPAFQVKGEFERMKQASTIDTNDAEAIRSQLVLWNATQYAHDHYIAFLKGATDNLLQPVSNGGVGLDLGRGAGVQVSPLNAIVAGSGVIGGSTLAARESNLKSAIGSLSTATASHLMSIGFLQNVSEEMSTSGKYLGIGDGQGEEFWCILPSQARIDLFGIGSTVADYSKYTMPLSESHPLFRFSPIKVGKLSIIFDDMLAKYAPDVSGSEIVWGKSSYAPQEWDRADLSTAQKNRGIGLVMGASSLLCAVAKSMSFTEAKGDHDVGWEIATKTYRSLTRPMFFDKQDSSKLPIDQSSMLIAFAMKGPSFT